MLEVSMGKIESSIRHVSVVLRSVLGWVLARPQDQRNEKKEDRERSRDHSTVAELGEKKT